MQGYSATKNPCDHILHVSRTYPILPNHPRPWRRGSDFGPGPRVPLNREERARAYYILEAHYRSGHLTAKGSRVGRALVRRIGADGRCDPSHATLARDAGCEPRTVQRALAAMRDLGLVHWVNRIQRNGWRCEQTSNGYIWLAGARPPEGRKPRRRCGGQIGRATVLLRRTTYFLPSSAPTMGRQEAAEALARAREQREARLAADWRARHAGR